jgi:hypothetical protein
LLLNIETHFAVVNDPRQYGKVDHPLINIIFITLCGVLWGTDDWLSFTEFARAQEKWLAKYLT